MNLFLVILLLICVSCNGGGGGGSAGTGAAEVTNIASSYVGLWAKCENDSNDNTSLLYVYSVSTNSIVSSYIFYSALNCQTANIVYDEKFVDIVTKSGANYHSTLLGASSTSLSNGDVTYNNTNSYCGYANWAINVPKDILSRNCGGNTTTAGDTRTFQLSISGANLLVTEGASSIALDPISSPDFTHAGTAITNASYSFFNDDIAYLFIFNSGSYTGYAYDTVTRNYYSEAGTYSVNQNLVTFTFASSTPNCGTAVGSTWGLYYSPNVNLSIIFKNVDDDILTAESTSWTETQFRNAYAGSGFVQGCL